MDQEIFNQDKVRRNNDSKLALYSINHIKQKKNDMKRKNIWHHGYPSSIPPPLQY